VFYIKFLYILLVFAERKGTNIFCFSKHFKSFFMVKKGKNRRFPPE